MNSNVNLAAPVGVLGLMGTSLVVLGLGLLALYGLVLRRYGRARVSLLALGVVLAVYFAFVIVFSLASGEKVLARGEEKYFCEIDCHLAYSIVDVRREKTLGSAQTQAAARGDFYVLTVKTRFDEKTISSRRGGGELYPNPRRVTVYDEQGRSYQISEEGQRALRDASGAGTPLDTPLRPGESYTTGLVFDLPADARNPVLLINESDLPTRFIIGHENSFLHQKTEFKL